MPEPPRRGPARAHRDVGTIDGIDDVVFARTPLILGWDDIAYGVRAYQRASWEYDIFYEDDWLGKVVLYRWMPICPKWRDSPHGYSRSEPDSLAPGSWSC